MLRAWVRMSLKGERGVHHLVIIQSTAQSNQHLQSHIDMYVLTINCSEGWNSGMCSAIIKAQSSQILVSYVV